MRISDWSSDVCSSDLEIASQIGHEDVRALYGQAFRERLDALFLSRRPSPAAPSFRDRKPRHKKGFPPLFQPVSGEARAISSSGLEGTLLRSEEHTSELQSLMRISYAVFCLTKKKHTTK